MSAPRIALMKIADVPNDVRTQLGKVSLSAQGVDNIYLHLLRHPALFATWGSYATSLLEGLLPQRDRELAVLRILYRASDTYDLHHHRQIAALMGLAAADIARAETPGDAGWSESDRAIVAGVDELFSNAEISDGVWAKLSERYSDEQMIEFVSVVGLYLSLAFLMKSLRTPLEN